MTHQQAAAATTTTTKSINTHLELCVNDLLHPTEKSESLLEALTSSQLENIERTLFKIKERKLSLSQQQQNVSKPTTTTTTTTTTTNDWTMVAVQIAKALADTITTVNNNNTNKPTPTSKPPSTATASTTPKPLTSSTPTQKEKSTEAVVTNHEPRTEMKDGVEWVSFVYSHHRVLRRYSIRTDVDKVDLAILDDKFKSDNCVYPRANLPREEYQGNRWAYETECNTLGWKLAYLNSTEIAGKRGLIQRAVDSYRNRYPSMRSRRVARQEKLLKGTLRKRKQRDFEESEEERPAKKAEEASSLPKTVSIDDGVGGKHRIRINVESVPLDAMDAEFRKANCVYPRAISINPLSPFASQRQIEEAKCNELAWKLAWLNPKQLANRKNLLQRVLDAYRSQFLPELNPRRNSLRIPTNPPDRTSIDTNMLLTKADNSATSPALTVAALAAQQQALDEPILAQRIKKNEDAESLYSGTTDSLDFHDCFSPKHTDYSEEALLSPLHQNIMLSAPITDDLMLSDSGRLSISSSSSSEPEDQILFKDNFSLYQLPSTGIEFDPSEYIKDEDHLIDPLISQLFHI